MPADDCSILIVSEDARTAALLRDTLVESSLRCQVALSDGSATLSGTHAVLLLDVASANGNLSARFSSAKQYSSESPAIIALGVRDDAQGLELLDVGACSYVVGPVMNAGAVIRAVRDALGRRALAAALEQSEARYARLLASVTDYTYTLRIEQGRPVSSAHSPGCAAVTGYTSEEYAADPHLWYRMIYESDRDAVIGMSEQVYAGQSPPPLEHRIIHKNGSIRWIKNTPVPRYDAAGRLAACDGLVSDITDRKIAEAKLQQEFYHLERAKQEWEVTFDSISDPIFIHDRDCRIIRANRAYQEVAGKPYSELIGRKFHDIFPRLEESVITGRPDLEPLSENQPYFVEEFSVPSIRRIFRGRVYPVQDADGAIISSVQVLEDVTEMKQAEETMRQEMEISTNLLALAETATDTLDPDRLMQQVVTCCARTLGTDTFFSYSWDSAAHQLRPGQHTPLPRGAVPMFRTDVSAGDSDLVRTALNSRRACVARRTEPDPSEENPFLLCQLGDDQATCRTARPFPWLLNANTFLAIPLYGRADRLGLLVAAYHDNRVFSERDRRMVEGISREVSLALDEACLYRTALERSMDLAHKMETLKVIHEIDLSILSSLEPQGILEAAVRNIRRIIPCDTAEAILTGPDREFLARISSELNGRDHDNVSRLALVTTAASEVLATCRPSYLPDISKAGPLLPEEERLRADGTRSLFRVPLMAKGSAIGVLSVASSRPAAFTPENYATLEQLAGLIGVAFENTRLLTDLQELLLGTVKSLSYAIDAKSSWTAGHSERVTRYALQLGQELGMNDKLLRDLELAGLLHDVGKLGTFDAILDKKSVLSTEEYEIIKRHPLHGAELLAPIKQMQQIIPAVRHHHERFDGKGYPDGLKGNQIPDLARILAVADAFDSMTGWRPYRKTFDIREAIAELKRCSGTQFDPSLADKFISIVYRTDLKMAS
ncbi:MAG: PAS domain S-box protein [Nitrospirota bacterium]|nr:PAS domain S-box protein [Nitrospirota bacterium]